MTEKLAFYLREYLQQSGYQEVQFIQQDQLPAEPELDLLVSCDFAVETSPLPLVKTGKIESDFTVQSFTLWPEVTTTKRFTFNYQGQETLTAEGLLAQQKSYDLLLQQTASRFVSRLNQAANSRFNLNQQEELSAPVSRGNLYQQLGTLTRRSDYLARAVEEYQRVIAKYGCQKFGLGAKKRLLQIKANPIYDQHDYQEVLNQLATSQIDNLDLAVTKTEVLFKQGRYQEALANLKQTNYENRELGVITRAKLGKKEQNLEKLRDYDLRREVKKKMVLIYNYYLRGKEKIAAKIAEDLKLNYPLWMIKEEANEFYRRTGIEIDVF